MESAEVKRGVESVGWIEAWNQLGGERRGISWVERGVESYEVKRGVESVEWREAWNQLR